MRSLEVKISRARDSYSFQYSRLLIEVAKSRFPEVTEGEQYEYFEDALSKYREVLLIDDLEDLFILKHLSVDLITGKAVVFYEDNRRWCFEHRMYITEDRHAEQCLKQEATVTEVYPGTPEWEASEIMLERQRREGG